MSKAANRKDQKSPQSLLFSAPALLAVRGSPLTARSFARRSFDRSKNGRKRKRLLAVYDYYSSKVRLRSRDIVKLLLDVKLLFLRRSRILFHMDSVYDE